MNLNSSIKTGESDEVHPRKRLGVALGMALAFIVVVSLVSQILHAQDLDRKLKDTQANLVSVESKLAQVKQENVARTAKEAQLNKALADKQAELDGVKASLLSSEGRVNLQAGNIATLRNCLDGVTLALVQVANNDLATAQQTLAGVQGPCRQAEALL